MAAQPSPGTVLFEKPVGVLKPGDDNNYEMSDRDASSDEDEEEEEEEDDGRAKKKIPDWAHGAMLTAAIHAQYGDSAIDPDTIFPEIQTCDLAEIFRNNKKRYTKRTSSGNWHNDRLKDHEKQQYRMDMGFGGR